MAAVAALVLTGCNSGQKEIDRLNQTIDSLQQVDINRQAEVSDLNSFITTISDGLDSIAVHQGKLTSNKGREGIYIDKRELKKNLEALENTVQQQRSRIANLVDSLRARGANIAKLQNLVNHLNQQLEEKEQMIQQLKADLEKKNFSISQLESSVSSLSESNSQLSEKVERQVQALTAQDEMMNEAYVRIATKKELAAEGLISGGFMKKSKANTDNFQKSKFNKVDIRHFKEIPTRSKSPKILTQMPASSYKLVKNSDDTMTLQILDPTTFWSVSNFLIIQTN